MKKRLTSGEARFVFDQPDRYRISIKSAWNILKIHQHPYGMPLNFQGISPGLKTCHRHVFPRLRRVAPFDSRPGKKEKHSKWSGFLFW